MSVNLRKYTAKIQNNPINKNKVLNQTFSLIQHFFTYFDWFSSSLLKPRNRGWQDNLNQPRFRSLIINLELH